MKNKTKKTFPLCFHRLNQHLLANTAFHISLEDQSLFMI